MADTNTFGAFLRSMRKHLNITQETTAKKAGISASYLAQLECGQRKPPSADIARRLARALALDENLVLSEAGHGDNPKTHIAPERIEWAFNAMCTDPVFKYGHAIHHRPFDMDTKAFLVEVYCYRTGRMLLTEGSAETSGLEGVAGINNPLDAAVNAMMASLEPPIRKLLSDAAAKLNVPEKHESSGVQEATSVPATEMDKLPVRAIKTRKVTVASPDGNPPDGNLPEKPRAK